MSSSHGNGSSNPPGSSSGSAYGSPGVFAPVNHIELTAALQGGNALMAQLETRCANSGERTAFDQLNAEVNQLALEMERITAALHHGHALYPTTASRIGVAVSECARLLNRAEALTAPGGEIATLVVQLAQCINRIREHVGGFQAGHRINVGQTSLYGWTSMVRAPVVQHQEQLRTLHAHFNLLAHNANALRAELARRSQYVG